jgi:site-specific recombinase XerD
MFLAIFYKFKKFTEQMKDELLDKNRKKSGFSWVLSEKKYLKLSEVNKLRKACKESRYLELKPDKSVTARNWFMIELGLYTGLRVDEMRNLKCGDLNIQTDQSSVSVRKGKGNKPRVVRISESFKNKCKRFFAWKQRKGQSIEPDAYLLTSNKDNQLSKRALQKAFKQCVVRAGLPHYCSVHMLRHTFATYLLKASNYNLRLVQAQLGHSSIRTTQVYMGLMDEDVKKAINRLYKQ